LSTILQVLFKSK